MAPPQQPARFVKGARVAHTRASDGLVRFGAVVGVHLDDIGNGVYYTLLLDDGLELQASERKLRSEAEEREWALDRALGLKYAALFAGVQGGTPICGAPAVAFFTKSGLGPDAISALLGMADQDQDGALAVDEFCVAFHIAVKVKKGSAFPSELPRSLRGWTSGPRAGVEGAERPDFPADAASIRTLAAPTTAADPAPPVSAATAAYPVAEPRPPAVALAPPAASPWTLPADRLVQYGQVFERVQQGGFASGAPSVAFFKQSGLGDAAIVALLKMADVDGDGQLSLSEFCVAFHIAVAVKKGHPMPAELPAELRAHLPVPAPAAAPLPMPPSETLNGDPFAALQPAGSFAALQPAGSAIEHSSAASVPAHLQRKASSVSRASLSPSPVSSPLGETPQSVSALPPALDLGGHGQEEDWGDFNTAPTSPAKAPAPALEILRVPATSDDDGWGTFQEAPAPEHSGLGQIAPISPADPFAALTPDPEEPPQSPREPPPSLEEQQQQQQQQQPYQEETFLAGAEEWGTFEGDSHAAASPRALLARSSGRSEPFAQDPHQVAVAAALELVAQGRLVAAATALRGDGDGDGRRAIPEAAATEAALARLASGHDDLPVQFAPRIAALQARSHELCETLRGAQADLPACAAALEDLARDAAACERKAAFARSLDAGAQERWILLLDIVVRESAAAVAVLEALEGACAAYGVDAERAAAARNALDSRALAKHVQAVELMHTAASMVVSSATFAELCTGASPLATQVGTWEERRVAFDAAVRAAHIPLEGAGSVALQHRFAQWHLTAQSTAPGDRCALTLLPLVADPDVPASFYSGRHCSRWPLNLWLNCVSGTLP
jgi:hypothetical protein